MILDLAYYGHPFLRKKALFVEKIDDDVRQFVKNLIETMQSFPSGIGLAATQVKSLYRIFVICPYIEEQEGEPIFAPPEVYINPKLSEPGQEIDELSEGCLSFPKLYLPVPRPISITVEAQDLDGKTFKKNLTGFAARQVMHENDHLNGILFIDRVDKKYKKSLDTKLSLIKKKFN